MALQRRKPVREAIGKAADTAGELLDTVRIATGALRYEASMMKLESLADYKGYLNEVATELNIPAEELEKLI